jgi:MFS family permease
MSDSNTNSNSAAPQNKGWRGAMSGNVLAMGLVSLFTDFSSEMMNPLLPLFIAGLVPVALAPLYLGLMEGIAEATSAILKIYSGRLSDKVGKRKALVLVGYGLSSVARPLMALATAGWHVIALKFFDRIGKGVRTSPRDALIGDSVDAANRGLAFSFHRMMDHAGAVLGPIVAIFILVGMLGGDLWNAPPLKAEQLQATPPAQMHSLRWLFAIAIIPGALAVAAIVLKVREVVPSKKATGPQLSAWRAMPGRFWAFLAAVTVFALGNSTDLFIVYLGYQYFGMGLLQLLVLWIALHVSKIVFSIPGGALSDRLGRRPMIVAGWAIYAMVYLGLAFADPSSLWQFWALVLAYGVYYGLTEGAEKALVTDFSPSEHRGTAFGLYHSAVGIAALPASLVFGVLWTWATQAYGADFGRSLTFSIGAGLAGLATVILLVLVTATPRKTAAA